MTKTNRVLTAAFLTSFTIVLILGLTACGIDSGTITSKSYTPPSSYTVSTCGGMDSKGQCIAWYPAVYFTPECWELDLGNEAGDTGSVCVDPHSWELVHPGEHWPRDLTGQ